MFASLPRVITVQSLLHCADDEIGVNDTMINRKEHLRIFGSNPIQLVLKVKRHPSAFCCGGWIRTNDLRVMSYNPKPPALSG